MEICAAGIVVVLRGISTLSSAKHKEKNNTTHFVRRGYRSTKSIKLSLKNKQMMLPMMTEGEKVYL